jgi:hypothetical protein
MSRGLSLAPCGLVIERIESGKRIQVLRMPVSPSGRRSRCEVRSGRCGQGEGQAVPSVRTGTPRRAGPPYGLPAQVAAGGQFRQARACDRSPKWQGFPQHRCLGSRPR